MASEQSEGPFAETDGPLVPCVRCQQPTSGTLFASANVFTGVDPSGRKITQWLTPIPVCDHHRFDLSRDMRVLSWCTTDQAWGLYRRPCARCGRLLTISYHRS